VCVLEERKPLFRSAARTNFDVSTPRDFATKVVWLFDFGYCSTGVPIGY